MICFHCYVLVLVVITNIEWLSHFNYKSLLFHTSCSFVLYAFLNFYWDFACNFDDMKFFTFHQIEVHYSESALHSRWLLPNSNCNINCSIFNDTAFVLLTQRNTKLNLHEACSINNCVISQITSIHSLCLCTESEGRRHHLSTRRYTYHLDVPFSFEILDNATPILVCSIFCACFQHFLDFIDIFTYNN